VSTSSFRCLLSRRLLSILLLTFSVCAPACSDGQRQVDETVRNGNRIIAALEQYRDEHGCYPDKLNDLSPEYLAEIPSATWGLGEWKYEADVNDFDLHVDESIHTGDGYHLWLRYLGKESGWQFGD